MITITLESLVNYLILLFITILAYFLLVLAIVHIKAQKEAAIKDDIQNILKKVVIHYKKTGINIISKYPELRSKNAIYVINDELEASKKINDPTLKILINESNYTRYINRLLKSSDENILIFGIKLIGELELSQFEKRIIRILYKHKTNADLQYYGLLTLSRLGDYDLISSICYDEQFTHILTFRSLQEIFKEFVGDKTILFRNLLQSPNTYIKRISIKRIGIEQLTQLTEDVFEFLWSDDDNLLIDAVRTLGQLKHTRSIDRIVQLIDHERWEVRSVCMTALGNIDIEHQVNEIITGLSDKEWWVRHNAAQALLGYSDLKSVLKTVSKTNDRFAKEILSFTVRKYLLEQGVI